MGEITIPDGRKVEFNGRAGEVSDGYHTFDDLYNHRMVLTRALMFSHPELSWRSKRHYPEGEPMFEGFFIVGMYLPGGVITYHYKLEHWDKFEGIRELEYAPKWDGHSPEGAIQRIHQFGTVLANDEHIVEPEEEE